MITSYPSIYNIGHKAIANIFSTEVLIEEKIDGSQFSFKRTGENTYLAKSKGAVLNSDIPDLFKPALATMLDRLADLRVGWTYRGEAVCRPKHNCLKYNRAPAGGIIIFDVDDGLENYLSREQKEIEAQRLNLELVPALFRGKVEDFEQFKAFLDRESCLGGPKIEGFVVKNYELFGIDKKVMMGKFVSEEFKEQHGVNWRAANPTNGDFIEQLVTCFKTDARWNKAVQHLTDAGLLNGTPEDIGLLIKEVPEDVFKEHEEEMKDRIWHHVRDRIKRGLTRGLPEWYKERLAKEAFNLEKGE